MKTKTLNFKKTDHFLYRLWDRGIDCRVIDAITSNIEEVSKEKTILIVGKSFRKKLGLKKLSNNHLIVVIKKNLLITAFYENNLYAYLKTLPRRTNVLTF